jgi:ribonucleoside-triphosphate reductase
LNYYLNLAKEALEIKRKVITQNLKKGLMPYTKAYLGSFRSYFSTIGVVGGNEACLNLLGVGIQEKKGKEFIVEVLKFIRQKLIEFQKETGNLYNLEATPAESTAYRLALLDHKFCPGIKTAGTREVPYLTNSTQLPVNATSDLWEALMHQNDIQPLYTGGTVFHVFLGEELEDAVAAKVLVKKIAETTRLPYFTLTPTFSICPVHGRLKGKVWRCPYCGKKTEVYSRIVGYYRPVSLWNKGKRQEYKERKEFVV